jgi:hypothetical protein
LKIFGRVGGANVAAVREGLDLKEPKMKQSIYCLIA